MMKYFTKIIFGMGLAILLGAGQAFGQEVITYTMQVGNFNNTYTEHTVDDQYFAGAFNNNPTEIGLYANGSGTDYTGNPGVAIFQTFTDDGNGSSGNPRALQIGDEFQITVWVGNSTSFFDGSNAGISFNENTIYSSFNDLTENTRAKFQLNKNGNWLSSTSTQGNGYAEPGADVTFKLKLTSQTTANLTISGANGATTYSMILANSPISNSPITSFALWNQTSGKENDMFWKGGSLTSTGTVEYGYDNAAAEIAGIISDGLVANSTSTPKVNNLYIGGTGTITFSALNTYTGSTNIQKDTLRVTSSGNLGNGSDIFISNGAHLDLNNSVIVSSLQEAGSGNGGTVSIATGTTLTINGADKGALFQNSISGEGNLNIATTGTSTLALYGTQTYTGTTTVSGNLTISSNLSSSAVTVESGGVLTISGNATLNDLTVNAGGTVKVESGKELKVSGTLTNNGTITYNRNITGTEGWRMLSSPVTGGTYGNLLGNIWTQGFADANYSSGDPNVQAFNVGTQGFGAIASLTDPMNAGQGFITYVYSDDDYTNSEADAGFPKTLSVSGTENSGTVDVSSNLSSVANGWSLVGNPYASTIDWADLNKTDLTEVVYVYDHSYNTIDNTDGGVDELADTEVGGGYRTYNGAAGGLTEGKIAAFQGFWVQNKADATAPALEFTETSKSTGGTFYKQSTQSASFRMIAQMDGRANDAYFSFTNEGKIGKDNYDALKLSPLDYADYLSLGTEVDGVLMDINNLPIGLSKNVEFPLEINSFKKIDGGYALKGGEVTLSLADLKNIPAEWGIVFNNYQTGETIDLRAQESYTFEIAAKEKMVKAKTAFSVLTPMGVTREKSVGSTGFSISIQPENTPVALEPKDEPKIFALEQNYPNPFNPTTTIKYSVAENGPVNLAVFNIMGQKVAELVSSTKQAGTYAISWQAQDMASGLYFYRLSAAGQTITRQMTLIK